MAQQTIEEAIPSWREELQTSLEQIYKYAKDDEKSQDYIAIMKMLSSFSSRATYIRSICVKSNNRKVIAFKSDEVDPFLKEVELQFRIWSRAAAIQKDEFEMHRGL